MADGNWFNQSWTPEQSMMIVLSIVMLSIIGLILVCWVSDVYRILPFWGPVRKFDSDSSEEQRIRQVLIHDHAMNIDRPVQDGPVPGQPQPQQYGAVGKPTWGVCESPNQGSTPFYHPQYGQCQIREGFAETQRMREQCDWWAKDEPHFMAARGQHSQQLHMNERHASNTGRMV
mmetsp:Transcript_39744/g.84856  ORF Transcript_39744/g.84856 Transcript_39744/m.84856 type:complete len:174 (-) Transcript_39744:80-601(-)